MTTDILKFILNEIIHGQKICAIEYACEKLNIPFETGERLIDFIDKTDAAYLVTIFNTRHKGISC